MGEKIKKNIIICGKGGSGKNYFQNILTTKFGYKEIKLATTRPIRPTEDGSEYVFLTEDNFNADDYIDVQIYRDWMYGVPDISKIQGYKNVIILTPKNITSISKKYPNIFENWNIIYITADESTIRERLSLRNDSDSVERRINADNIDFDGFEILCDFEINTNIISDVFTDKVLKLLNR